MSDVPSGSPALLSGSDGIDSSVRRPAVLGPAAIVALGIALYLPGFNWGLPGTVSWSQDTIAGYRTIGAVAGWPQRWEGRYAPWHYLLLRAAYEPILRHWERRGQLIRDPATGRHALEPPHAEKIGTLIRLSRSVSVVMAIGAALLLWTAARHLTGDALTALIAGCAFLIGAEFVYFAHLSNVDVPSIFWFCGTLLFYVRALRSPTWKNIILLGLFGSLAISTKDALAGAYPGMALVLLVAEAKRQRDRSLGAPDTTGTTRPATWSRALLAALFQPKWVAGLAAIILPYLLLNGVFWNPEAWVERMGYWLSPAPDTLHARQHRYDSQAMLLLASAWYAAGAVGWPMLAAMFAATVYCLARRRWLAIIALAPAVSYYLIVIVPIEFVYARFLFPVLVMMSLLLGVAGAVFLRHRRWPIAARAAVATLVLVPSLGYAAAVNVEMINDSRYQAEAWFLENVEPTASIGAFSHPQYLPRLAEMGYDTFGVTMTRESFQRPQPEYLVLTSFNYEDFDEAALACMEDLLAGRLGYAPVATFRGRYLGTGRHWLAQAGWGAPAPGKISPTLMILRRKFAG